MKIALYSGLVILLVFLLVTAIQGYRLVHHPLSQRDKDPLLPTDVGLASEEVTIQNNEGQRLYGYVAPSNNGAYVMLQHGYKADRSDLLEEAKILQEAGYGILISSVRAHDKNDGDKIMFGINEIHDLQAWYDYLLDLGVTPGMIGVLGNSLGAYMASRLVVDNPDISALVMVSSFSSLTDTLNVTIPYMTGLPAFPFVTAIQAWAEFFSGIKSTQIDTTLMVKQMCNTPLLIMQGGADKVVSVASGEWIYEAATCDSKELWFEPDVEHVSFDVQKPVEFKRRLLAFFDSHLLPTKSLTQ